MEIMFYVFPSGAYELIHINYSSTGFYIICD